MSDETRDVVFSGEAAAVKRESARRTRRSFIVGGAVAAAAAGVDYWINSGRIIGRQQVALRRTFETDAEIFRTVFAERGLAPTYPLSMAKELRLNGIVGMQRELDLASWRLQLAGVANAQQSPLFTQDITAWQYKYNGVIKDNEQSNDVKSAPGNEGPDTDDDDNDDDDDKTPPPEPNTLNPTGAKDSAAGAALADRIAKMVADAQPKSTKRNIGDAEAGPSASSLDIGTPGLLFTMEDLKKLPRVEFVTQFKCIEGWSGIVQWAGVRLRDLIEAHPPATVNGREPKYVYMETPDGNYYGGYDMAAARHPQSLLVMEMSGKPLSQHHGAPLRLHMPIKYGYKQLKRIGLIAYTDMKPDDYWTKLGYDWYAGL